MNVYFLVIISNAKEKKLLHVFNILLYTCILKKIHGVKNRFNYDHWFIDIRLKTVDKMKC